MQAVPAFGGCRLRCRMPRGPADRTREALIKSMCRIGEQFFLSANAPKSPKYWMYFKILGLRQAENLPSRCARGFNQRFPSPFRNEIRPQAERFALPVGLVCRIAAFAAIHAPLKLSAAGKQTRGRTIPGAIWTDFDPFRLLTAAGVSIIIN